MRNKVTLLIFLLLFLVLIVAIFFGIKLGNFQILSVQEIMSKNEQLNKDIAKANELSTVKYQEKIKTLEKTYEDYKLQKQEYEEISGFTEKEESGVYETKQYDVGYLWSIVGKSATKYNLKIVMEVNKGTGENNYNLNFEAKGAYVNISNFIKEIENNSDLFFRIYNFKMSGNTDAVVATFVVKDINLDSSAITGVAKKISDSKDKTNVDNEENKTDNENLEE